MNTLLGLCAGYCRRTRVVITLGARNPYQRDAERTNPLPVRLNSLSSRVALYMVIARSKTAHYVDVNRNTY